MIHHNPRVPLLGSFLLLAVAMLGTVLDGFWSLTAFVAAVAIQFGLLLQSQAHIQDDVREMERDFRALEVDVRGVLGRDRGPGSGAVR